MLEVSEYFRSLQGEGPHMGKPAFFLRLARCVPPFCPFCDTPEGLQPGTLLKVETILDLIRPARDRLVVITGGEPFRQWGAELSRLEKALLDRNIAVQYETSGKAPIPPQVQGEIICSPKFLDKRWQFDQTNFARDISGYKFVATGHNDEILHFIDRGRIPAGKVWIMPLGGSRQEQLRLGPQLWEFCVQHGFNYAPRLHILTFDRQKGI